jgi:hypothetical protein
MTRRIKTTGLISLAALVAAGTLSPAPALAQEVAEATLNHVDAPSGRVSDRGVGYLRFTKGKGENQVDVLVQILNLPDVQGEEPLMTVGGHAVYRHGMRIRSSGNCEDLTPTESQAGVLPDVGVQQNGMATLSITANGIAMSELPGKSVVLYRSSNEVKKRQIIACGVIKED